MTKSEISLFKIISVILIVLFVFIVGNNLTKTSMNNGWYSKGPNVSSYQPKPIVFAIIWTVLYILYALSWSYLVNKINSWVNLLFLLNMVLNLLWTYVFFVRGELTTSKIIIVLLLITTLTQIYIIYRLKKKLKYNSKRIPYYNFCLISLALYTLWLLAATYLNFAVHL
jgi:tryptophan-rich sensory protein